MPRSRRRRPRRDDPLPRLIAGWRRTEVKHGRQWSVQPVSGDRAVKEYLCPGCGGVIEVGLAHVVTWREDGVLGDAADLAARRHWHTHCWRVS